MKIAILGPLEVGRGGHSVPLGPKQQTLLAILLVNRDARVSADRIVDGLYEGRPPRNALKTLQVHVSRLRKALGDEMVQTVGGGYRLALAQGTLDADRFEELADAGRVDLAEQRLESASTALGNALALWRGPALADFAYADFAQAEIARLEESRLAVLEDRIDADLGLGRHAAVVAELEALVRGNPLRERLRGQLMLALYRSGRQAEALDAYREARRALVDELGIEPSRALRDLQQAILAQDAGLELDAETPEPAVARDGDSSTAPVPTSHESRKTVTALSASISGSPTEGANLDAEALRRVTSVVFTRVSDAINAHGGKVESVSAEAMSAVFGVPEVHEDDTLRAVRAAVDIHESLVPVAREHLDDRGVELEVQIGISTGEVVVGGAAEATLLVTGAPFIRAERLARVAEPGETLLDDATVQRVARLIVGESKTVAGRSAFRLSRLRESADDEPRFTAPMVGRERERRRLVDAYEQAVADRSCQLFTILGAAGVGKSRLVQEFLEGSATGALVARGRCLPYGEGITFWPVLEAIKEIVEVDDATPETTPARLAELLPDAEDAERIGVHVAEMIGFSEARATAEERASAMSRLVEELGRRGPLVLVFDDIHWGEETFLDLVEHLADWCRDTSVLLVCMARPELLDARPSWGGGKLNATSVLLEPLSDDDCETLVGHLLGDPQLSRDVRRRITDIAEGNPLFVEELVGMLIDDGILVQDESGWVATRDLAGVPVPPTISGLVLARLDRLPLPERAVVERAAVEGKVFHRSSVEALSPGAEPSVVHALGALVRKELIRPDRPVFAGEEAYRFRHLLIRDTAYESIPKQLRAELHEQHGAWLQTRIGRAVEYDEIVGYHLEQTYRYRSEVGQVDDRTRAAGRRAAELLGSSGRRAFLRSDAPAGANLLARAVALLPPDDPARVGLIPNVRVVQGLGDLSWADRVLTEAVEASATTGNRELAAHALVQRGLLRLFSDPTVTPLELFDVSERAVRVFEELQDELGLSRAWRLAAQAHYLDRHARLCAEASEQALVHARRSDPFEEREVIEWLVIALILGPEPASSALARCDELLSELDDDSLMAAEILAVIAPLLAMRGRAAEAADAFERAKAIMTEQEEWIWIAVFWDSFLHVWHGTARTGEPELRTAYESLKAIGEKSHFSSLAHALANVVLSEGRYDEAEVLVSECEAASRPNDIHSQIASRTIRARIMARRGAYDDAESLARDAIDFGADSDFLLARAEAHEGLAEVLGLAGRPAEEIDELEEAVALYDEKENELASNAVRARLRGLSP